MAPFSASLIGGDGSDGEEEDGLLLSSHLFFTSCFSTAAAVCGIMINDLIWNVINDKKYKDERQNR